MKEISLNTLQSMLDSREDHSIFLLAGDDRFRMDRITESIFAAYAAEDLLRIDLQKPDQERLEEALYAVPLAGRRGILIENCVPSSMSAEASRRLSADLLDVSPQVTVVVRMDLSSSAIPSKRIESIFGKLDALLITVLRLQGYALQTRIREMAKEEGAEIDDRALSELAALVGDDLMLADNEIKKLAAFSNYGRIKAEHIEALTTKTAEQGVFDMISQLERRNLALSLDILRSMLQNKEEPLLITTHLNTAFINLYRAKLAKANRLGEADLFSMFPTYKKGDKKVGIAFRRAKDYHLREVEQILSLLYQLDLDLKTLPIDRGLILEQALIEIAAVRSAV